MHTITLGRGKAVPLVLTQRWRFFFSTKLRKWGGVHFTDMCFCASVSTHTAFTGLCSLFSLCASSFSLGSTADKNWCGHISGGGFSSRCMAKHSSKTLETGFYLFNSCMLHILCSHPSSICVGDFSEVEYFYTFLGIKMKSNHFGVWLPTDVTEEKWLSVQLLSNLSQPGRLHLVLQMFVMVPTKFTVTC